MAFIVPSSQDQPSGPFQPPKPGEGRQLSEHWGNSRQSFSNPVYRIGPGVESDNPKPAPIDPFPSNSRGNS
jgi:hypothetical protein